MTTLYIAVLTAGLILMAVYVFIRIKGPGVREILLKAFTSFFFVLTLFSAAAAEGEHFGFACLVGGGLLLGLLGDIWLELKNFYRDDEDQWTFAGFGCFMAGHFFYISAVISVAGVDVKALLIGAAAVVIAVLFVLIGGKPLKLNYGRYRIISVIYGGVLFFMSAFTVSTAVMLNDAGLMVMGIGSVIFLLSDLILSMIYFGKEKGGSFLTAANLILYYIGQFTIASAVLLVGISF